MRLAAQPPRLGYPRPQPPRQFYPKPIPRRLPERKPPVTIAAGLLWELAKKAFLSFVSTYISVSNLIYGSVAAIIAFLVWAYLSSLIFLFGAFLSVSYFHLRQQQQGAAG